MRIVIALFVIHGALALPEFGTSYLKNSRLCKPWTCINSHLHLNDSLPAKEVYRTVLHDLLPAGEWQDVIEGVVHACYQKRPRKYTNSCPGQALMHCTLDQMIEQCPESKLAKNDGCSPVSSLAGFKYMFSQSRYDDLEENLKKEARPVWFMKNYFSSNCCELPELFKPLVLSECGFNSLIHYYNHRPPSFPAGAKVSKTNAEKVRIAMFKNVVTPMPTKTEDQDPLSCCDLKGFITEESRSKCGFQLTWDPQSRLTVTEEKKSESVNNMANTVLYHDVRVKPLPCEKETCIFRNLGIISDSGSVDLDAYTKLLDDMTRKHPEWNRAKARVITECLSKGLVGYEDSCEINRILGCTFDVLSENCPNKTKISEDPCRHGKSHNETLCQVSVSNVNRHRHQFCAFPRFVPAAPILKCDLKVFKEIEYVPQRVQRKAAWLTPKKECKESTQSSICLASEMGVLNSYNFIDHFMMKEKIRGFTRSHPEWSMFTNLYMSASVDTPLYEDFCSPQKQILNVLDFMIKTCPLSRRKKTETCNRMFTQMSHSNKTDKTHIRPKTHFSPARLPVHIPMPFHLNLIRPKFASPYLRMARPNIIEESKNRRYLEDGEDKVVPISGDLNADHSPIAETLPFPPKQFVEHTSQRRTNLNAIP